MDKVRTFWADHQQRKTVMWVIAAVSLLILAFGAYTAGRAELNYRDLSDKLKKKLAEQTQFLQQFMVQQNGQTTPDASKITQADQMILIKLKQDEIKIKNDRVNAYNQRSSGLRIVGFGMFGLALAYLLLPERKREPEPDETSEVPPSPTKPPFDLSQ